jgi:hypothetical protein
MRRSDAPDASPVDPPLAALDAAPPPPAIVGRPWPAPVRPEAPVATIAAADAAWPEVHPDVDDAGGTPEPRGADAPSPTALRPADPGQIEDALSAPRPIRIVLVEDVPDVATHVRDMLRWQPRFQLIHVITDGRRAVEQITDCGRRLVDSLLGPDERRTIVEGLRAGGAGQDRGPDRTRSQVDKAISAPMPW